MGKGANIAKGRNPFEIKQSENFLHETFLGFLSYNKIKQKMWEKRVPNVKITGFLYILKGVIGQESRYREIDCNSLLVPEEFNVVIFIYLEQVQKISIC